MKCPISNFSKWDKWLVILIKNSSNWFNLIIPIVIIFKLINGNIVSSANGIGIQHQLPISL